MILRLFVGMILSPILTFSSAEGRVVETEVFCYQVHVIDKRYERGLCTRDYHIETYCYKCTDLYCTKPELTEVGPVQCQEWPDSTWPPKNSGEAAASRSSQPTPGLAAQ